MTKKGQNDKTQARPVVVSPYQNWVRKNGLGVCPISNAAIFGLKMPKNAVFAVHTVPSSKVLRIWLQIMQIQNVLA